MVNRRRVESFTIQKTVRTSCRRTPNDRVMSDSRRSTVLIALQQALLGEIASHLRAVTVEYDDQSVHFTAYFDGDVSEDDRESLSCVESEVMAALPASNSVTHDVTRLDVPVPIPKNRTWVYHRAEPISDN
jgi:hypothetical protein